MRAFHQTGVLPKAWTAVCSLAWYEPRRFHRRVRDPAELLDAVTDALANAGLGHALTLGSGARLAAPDGTDAERAREFGPGRASGRLNGFARASELQPVEEGEAVRLVLTRERPPLIFRRQVHGFWVASDVQFYLAPWAWRRRGKEQARHLRAERLG